LAETLPGGTGKIDATVTGITVRYSISISWDLREEEQENNATTKTITWVMQI
jgi:hypothetical protein